jgi:hypothetical protein
MIKVDVEDIHKAHNNVFVKTFSDPENVKVLLKMALPETGISWLKPTRT